MIAAGTQFVPTQVHFINYEAMKNGWAWIAEISKEKEMSERKMYKI